jgi:shikimate kinase
MKSNIAIIGFMGTGKSVVGKALAQKLHKKLIEIDDIIATKAGKTIPEIFRQDGETRFRELEIDVMRNMAAKKNAVIDCGGGVVLNSINIDHLKKDSVIVCLTASLPVIMQRTPGDTRPLLPEKGRAQFVKSKLAFRRPLYRQAADITVNTSRLDVNGVVDKIIKLLKKYESRNQ